MTSCKLLYNALSFVESSVKNSLAKSDIRVSLSSRHFAISPSCPLTLIMPFRIRWVKTINVFFFTIISLSDRPSYSLSLFCFSTATAGQLCLVTDFRAAYLVDNASEGYCYISQGDDDVTPDDWVLGCLEDLEEKR